MNASPSLELLAIALLLLVVPPCSDAHITILITVVRKFNWYNLPAECIEQLTIEDNVEILQIAPPSPLQISRKATVYNHLVADYHQGYSMGFALSEQLRTEPSLSSIF